MMGRANTLSLDRDGKQEVSKLLQAVDQLLQSEDFATARLHIALQGSRENEPRSVAVLDLTLGLRSLLRALASSDEVLFEGAAAAVSIPLAAELLGTSESYVRNLIAAGKLQTRRIGLVDKVCVNDLLRELRTEMEMSESARRELTALSEDLGHYRQQ
jgi:hypothetical protein